ncbi:MAG: peptidylprolyl isomerase [Chitinophagaceae bacterium]
MSILQSIRDKAAWIIIAAIALALIAFIVQDALQGGSSRLFSGSSTTLGKINGTSVDYIDFEQKAKVAEENYRAGGQNVDEQLRRNIRESLWNQYVEDAVYDKELDKLGIEVGDTKEMGDILYGANPPQQLKQAFTDPKTQQYDGTAAFQAIKGLKKGSAQYNSFHGEFIPAIKKARQKEKFVELLSKSYYVPKWLVEKTNAENSQRSTISYVNIPYSSIPDSSVKVTDEDIQKYIDAHKASFKQDAVSRSIQYVMFDAGPNGADSAGVYKQLAEVKDSFANVPASGINAFLVTQNSQSPYYESNISRKEIKIPNIDSIINVPAGVIHGPYLDANAYVLSRVVDVKQWPDTVNVRHILIATHSRNENGQMIPVREDADAKKLADSLATAIRGGSNFDSLCVKFSDDPGSKEKGGVYEKITSGRMVAPFNDFIFGNGTGAKGVIKTDFGYHYIEVLSQKGSSPAYKIAYLSKSIYPSDQTVNAAEGKASQFAAESRSFKDFEGNAKKQNLNVFTAPDVKSTDENIMGLGNSRELVRWVYNEAKEGKVADHAFLVGDKYVVPVVVSINEKGLMSVAKARPMVEYKVRNEKKAALIAQKVGTATSSLDAISKVVNQPVLRADSLSFTSGFVPNVGNEIKLIGAAFNKANQTKVSDPINGEMGVFYIKVDNIVAVPSGAFDAKQQQLAQQQQQQSMIGYRTMEVIKKAADIKDNRVKFY